MAAPDIREEDVEAVTTALRSGMLSQGPFTRRLEEAFAAYVGVTDAIAVSSGTSALHLCVKAAGVGVGDEVVTTPFSYIASSNCILFEGGIPVFVDIEEETMNIDPGLVSGAVTERTRALLPVHVFGQPCAMNELEAECRKHDLLLIEDACEAIGSEYQGRRVGSFGHSAVFSFFPNKQMTTGEGAVITCNDSGTAALLRSLRNQGREEGGAWLTHERVGYNYRMTELSAALGVTQFARIEEMLAMREKVAGHYRDRFAEMRGIRLIEPARATTRLSWFAAIARLDPAFERDVVIERLDALGIPARAYFEPLHLQPAYRRLLHYGPGDFPVAERVARTTLALPFHNAMTEMQVEMVCEALEQVLT